MPYLPLKLMPFFQNEFEKHLKKYTVKKYSVDDFDTLYCLDNSLILWVGFIENSMPIALNYSNQNDPRYIEYNENPYLETPREDGKYYDFHVEELTYNELGFRFNNTDFIEHLTNITHINYLSCNISYTRFKGYKRLYWSPDTETAAEYFNRTVPELKLRERYEKWEGLKYYLIVIFFEDISGEVHHAVAYTMRRPQEYIIQVGNYAMKHRILLNGEVRMNRLEMQTAFKSWKGTSIKERLEKHLSYYAFKKCFHEKDDVWRYADLVLEKANAGYFNSVEKTGYMKPVNKWVSEELVYKITKKLYRDYAVIYQHRPSFLRSSSGGQMSYDIFISGLNIAIEYQGKQHYEPVGFFGGEEAFHDLQKRDREKAQLSKENGIKLIYINYWEEITPELIREKIEKVT